jgi:hypothetical protein
MPRKCHGGCLCEARLRHEIQRLLAERYAVGEITAIKADVGARSENPPQNSALLRLLRDQ